MEVFETRILLMTMYISSIGFIAYSQQSAATHVIVVDGLKHPTTTITITLGDSVVFRHNNNVYMFRSRLAFNLCNFTQATLLTNSSSYTWRPSRPGMFYVSFNTCQRGQKLTIEVVPQTSSVAAPPPESGGDLAPGFPWPFMPHEKSGGPMQGPPVDIGVAMAPVGSIPYINSNPAVPLPASEVDSSAIFPLPTSAIQNAAAAQELEMLSCFGCLITQCILIMNAVYL